MVGPGNRSRCFSAVIDYGSSPSYKVAARLLNGYRHDATIGIRTPDNLGYFGYNPSLSAYVEVISYTKLLRDAKKRNKILFDKLNLPMAGFSGQ